MTYHIIIQQERRTPVVTEFGVDVSRLAIELGTSVPTGNIINDMPEYVAGPVQLHTHSAASLPENLDDQQFVMVAEWDGTSPYVTIHKGDYSQRTMGYAGWPELTMEEYEAQKEKGDAPLGTPPL